MDSEFEDERKKVKHHGNPVLLIGWVNVYNFALQLQSD